MRDRRPAGVGGAGHCVARLLALDKNRVTEEFGKLVETVARLRGPGGCPWDRQQTHDSLKRYVIEETYEVVEAIDSRDSARLQDELGDLMLQVLLHAQMASESGEFDIGAVCRSLREKLVRRHPHVFGEVEVEGVDEVLHNWEQIKRGEPGYEHRTSVLDGIPRSLPALMRAAKLSKRAAKTGFDWPDARAIVGKLREETTELEEALEADDPHRLRHEIGDLLFTVVNIARFQSIDPEESLREMLDRFQERFAAIEARAQESGRKLADMTLQEMDSVWEEAKRGKSP